MTPAPCAGRAGQDELDRIFAALADRTRRDIMPRVVSEQVSGSALATSTPSESTTIVAEMAAPPERVWPTWADARQLEREQREQVLAMGAVEGMTQAMGQIDAILTAG